MHRLDKELGSALYLDGIVTLVDAKFTLQHLERRDSEVNECERQIALADRIIVNKARAHTIPHTVPHTPKTKALNYYATLD